MRARRLRIREIDFERIIRRISIRTFYIRKYKRIHSINSSFCIRFFLACNSNILSLTIRDSEGNRCGIVFRAAALVCNGNTMRSYLRRELGNRRCKCTIAAIAELYVQRVRFTISRNIGY